MNRPGAWLLAAVAALAVGLPAPARTEDCEAAGTRAPASASRWLALGQCALRAGRPESARRAFTQAIDRDRRLGEAWAGRAVAAAGLGDGGRARDDLAWLASFDPALAARTGDAVAARLAAAGQPPAVEASLTALRQAAAENPPAETLRALAAEVHRAADAVRVRHAEWHGQQRARLEAALRAEPASPARLLALAAFLLEEAAPAQRAEPAAPGRALRPWRDPEGEYEELIQARNAADRTLLAEPGHPQATALKAMALVRLGQDDPAEAVAQRLAANPAPEAALALARYRLLRIGRWLRQAWLLRHPECLPGRSGCPAPRPADLRLATTLENRAGQLRRASTALLQRAAAAAAGGTEAPRFAAELAWAQGRDAEALETLRAAARQPEAHTAVLEALHEALLRRGDEDEALALRHRLAQTRQTTAAWVLERAWRRLARQRDAEVEPLLEEAARADPADARPHAWLAVLHVSRGRGPEALAAARTALALEEARLERDAREAPGPADRAVRAPDDLALAARLRLLLAELHERMGDGATAAALRQANAPWLARLDPRRTEELAGNAVLPAAPPGLASANPALEAMTALTAAARSAAATAAAGSAGEAAVGTAAPAPAMSTAAPVRPPAAPLATATAAPPPTAAAAVPAAAPLDPALPGIWMTVQRQPDGSRLSLYLIIEAGGTWLIRTADARAVERGDIQAAEGRVTMRTRAGSGAPGTYRIRVAEPDKPGGARTDILVLNLPEGDSYWQRLPDAGR